MCQLLKKMCKKSNISNQKEMVFGTKAFPCGIHKTITSHYKWHFRVDFRSLRFPFTITDILNQLSLLHGEDHSLY